MRDMELGASHRINGVAPPIIPIVADLIKQNPGTISLGQGVVNYGPPDSVINHIKNHTYSNDFHLYSDVQGLPELRNQVCEKLKQENNIQDCSPDRIVITAGANMAFVNAIMAIADIGDEIILLSPFYFNHEMAINMLNCKSVVVETDSEFQPDIEKIKAAINNKTRAVVTVSPNNPSGAVYTKETLEEINNICKSNGIYHISDEAYEYFLFDGAIHFSVASMPDSQAHTISLFSLSKSYGFASWRIGYMLIPEKLTASVKKIQDTNLICPPRIAQEAAMAALNAGRTYCEAHLADINEIRNTFYTELQSISNICTTIKTRGAFYFLLKLETDLKGMQLLKLLITKHKIAAIPGETFGLEKGCYLRIAYAALDKTNANIGIQRLIDGLIETISK